MDTIHILSLNYSLRYNDPTIGKCYVGEGKTILSTYRDKETADGVADGLDPLIADVEMNLSTQALFAELQKRFGVTLRDIDNSVGYFFKVETFPVS